VLIVMGKGNKTRMVPCCKRARADCRLCRDLSLPAWPEGPMFVGARGGPLSPRIIQLAMERLRGALGLPDSATPHALRHSFATHLLSRGGDLARDPGTAWSRLAFNDTDLYRHRQRTAAGSLSQQRIRAADTFPSHRLVRACRFSPVLASCATGVCPAIVP